MSELSKPSDDDYSTDEDEVIRDFDNEAKLIINSETLPKKSTDRYNQVYEAFKKWLNDNNTHLSDSYENNLIIYFNELKQKLKPTTLWSIWSMLKKTLNTKDEININTFFNLKAMLKSNSKGYKPVKSLVFKWHNIEKFIKEADDHTYLAMKVILIFGISGALRCDEIVNLNTQDVEDLKNRYLVSIKSTKNDYDTGSSTVSRQLLIGPLFYNIVKLYISKRPTKYFTDRFFIRYQDGKCVCQVIGINKIYDIPEIIANYLGLTNPEKYTGHCFRRTGATLLADSGADFQKVKQLGGWVSDKVCHGYVENSLYNRQQIFDGVTHGASTSIADALSRPSTSKDFTVQSINENKENSPPMQLNWDDFATDITVDDLDHPPVSTLNQTQAHKAVFVTAQNNPIKENSGTKSNASLVFTSKPPIKVLFNENSIQPPTKKSKLDSNKSMDLNDHSQQVLIQNKENNSSDSTNCLKNSYLKYENCTFHGNIINNFYSCENYKK